MVLHKRQSMIFRQTQCMILNNKTQLIIVVITVITLFLW